MKFFYFSDLSLCCEFEAPTFNTLGEAVSYFEKNLVSFCKEGNVIISCMMLSSSFEVAEGCISYPDCPTSSPFVSEWRIKSDDYIALEKRLTDFQFYLDRVRKLCLDLSCSLDDIRSVFCSDNFQARSEAISKFNNSNDLLCTAFSSLLDSNFKLSVTNEGFEFLDSFDSAETLKENSCVENADEEDSCVENADSSIDDNVIELQTSSVSSRERFIYFKDCLAKILYNTQNCLNVVDAIDAVDGVANFIARKAIVSNINDSNNHLRSCCKDFLLHSNFELKATKTDFKFIDNDSV